MVTINVLNIEGKGQLPIHGDGKTESYAAGYDIIAVDDPTVVGEVGNELTTEDGTKVILYKNISYLEYHTALKVQPLWSPYGDYHHIDMHPRSSVRKYNLMLANSIGLIDNDYRGEILVSFKYIFQPEDFVIQFEEVEKGFKPFNLLGGINWTRIYRKGDKIAQLVAEKTNECNYVFVSELSTTTRGEGGHGSTDKPRATITETVPNIPILRGEFRKTETKTSPDPEQEVKKQEAEHKQIFGTIAERYQKAGGIPTKKRYSEEIKEREQGR